MLSHPNKKLRQHFKEVYEIIMNKENFKIYLLDKRDLEIAIKILAYCHDFGKYNINFQKYIIAIRDNKKYDGLDIDKSHQDISALFALFIGDKYFNDKKLSLICSSAIFSHHGRLKEFTNIFTRYKDNEYISRMYRLRDFIEVNKKYILEDYKDIFTEKDIDDFFKCNFEIMMKKYYKIYKKSFNKSDNIDLFLIHSLLYSVLIEADKLSASDTILPNINTLTYDEFYRIKNKIFPYGKSYRDLINREVMSELKNNIDKKIFTITSPTGSGKTITGVEAAMFLRDKSRLNKIFYVLPFTSIINQSYQVMKEFYLDKDNTYIMKYHSMSNEGYRIDNKKEIRHNNDSENQPIKEYNKNYSFNQMELLMNSFNSGFIITTFNQLIESVISTKNKMLKKFNNFNNSVILIDEIQCLPLSYIKAIEDVLISLTENMNVKIIIMTATKPFVFKNTSIELLKDYKKYFEIQNRTKINFIDKLNEIDNEELIDIILNNDFNKKSIMVISNTISASLNIYNALKKHCCGNDIYYLSTNIIPVRRQQIIDEVKNRLKNGHKIKLVCTQLVEAGVDLDFNHVYRDIAPLASIIQAAGRCNREANKNYIGSVSLFKLIRKDSGKLDSSYVYNLNNDLIPTLECLSKFSNKYQCEINEKDYLDLIDEFYNKMSFQYGQHQDSIDLSIDMYRLDFRKDGFLDKFSLLKNNGYIDIYIPYGEEGSEILNKYKEVNSLKDINKKREELYKIKSYIQLYKISIPIILLKGKEHLLEDINGFIYVKPEFVEYVYDFILGFKRYESGEGEGIFI